MILQTSSLCTQPYPSSDTIPDIIEARETAMRILEKASRVVPNRVSSSTRSSASTIPDDPIGDSESPSSSSNCSAICTCSRSNDIGLPLHVLPNIPNISSVIPVVIQQGWLEAKDVARYELTCKYATQDAYIWKALFRHQQSQKESDWYSQHLLSRRHNYSKSSYILELFSSPVVEIWFIVAIISATCFVPFLFVGLENGWKVWAGIFGTIFGLTLVEGIVLAAIRSLLDPV